MDAGEPNRETAETLGAAKTTICLRCTDNLGNNRRPRETTKVDNCRILSLVRKKKRVKPRVGFMCPFKEDLHPW